MSNATLKMRIADAVTEFEAERIKFAGLRSAVVENGRVLEAMPYQLID